ncbi:MAG TPA: dihydrofolate reductase family protein, partial [Gaiellaceae bacterium]|nr:dihydrofolate reductase family protein [Gaiellaceae bacterium]
MTLAPLELLAEQPDLPHADLPEELRMLYGGGLGFAGPRVYANFVETIDGVVSIPDVERSNALVADESVADKFVIGLLRAFADVVVIGSGTMLASPKGTWRADMVHPPAAGAFAELRRRLGKSEHPAVAIVTAGRSLDPMHPVLERGAIVLTTAHAARRLAVPAAAEVVAVNEGDSVDPAVAVAALRARGFETILSEGGPALFTSLLAAGVVDELFLTVSPLLAGRSGRRRLSLADGIELLPNTRVGAMLLSI